MNNLSPLRYPGGKNKIYNKVLKIVKETNSLIYIDPFVGGASIPIKLIQNNEVEKIIINDFDKAIYAFWYNVLNNHERLIKIIKDEEVTIENWHKHKAILKNKDNENNLLKLGFSTLFLNRTNRSGILNAGVIGGLKQEGNYKLDCRFNKDKIIKKIELIAKNSHKIELYNLDVNIFIKEVVIKTDNSFIMFDPPYFEKGKTLYPEYFTESDHKNLRNTIDRYLKKHNWIITYDNNKVIKNLYKDYKIEEFSINYSIVNSKNATEIMIYNLQ